MMFSQPTLVPHTMCAIENNPGTLVRQTLNSVARNEVRYTLAHARPPSKRADFDPGHFFELWRAFNTWLQVVVAPPPAGRLTDAYMVKAAGQDATLSAVVNDLLQTRPRFQARAKEFYNLWPVFDHRWLRSKHILFWGQAKDILGHKLSRNAYVQMCFQQKQPSLDSYRPPCYATQQTPTIACQFVQVPLDWAHTLQAIYQVRCNYLHDMKGRIEGAVVEDYKFLYLSHYLLWQVWGKRTLGR
jgi:hypothetical protein